MTQARKILKEATPRFYSPQLDGVRFLAALAVFIYQPLQFPD